MMSVIDFEIIFGNMRFAGRRTNVFFLILMFRRFLIQLSCCEHYHKEKKKKNSFRYWWLLYKIVAPAFLAVSKIQPLIVLGTTLDDKNVRSNVESVYHRRKYCAILMSIPRGKGLSEVRLNRGVTRWYFICIRTTWYVLLYTSSIRLGTRSFIEFRCIQRDRLKEKSRVRSRK